jgi:hypothetical protein
MHLRERRSNFASLDRICYTPTDSLTDSRSASLQSSSAIWDACLSFTLVSIPPTITATPHLRTVDVDGASDS